MKINIRIKISNINYILLIIAKKKDILTFGILYFYVIYKHFHLKE